jgi:hypothetical protein
MNWQLQPQSWETEAVIQNIRQYGVNVIRRHFSYYFYEHNRSIYINRMKNIAEMAAQNGMWIIFDLYNNINGVGTTEERVAGMRWLWKMPEGQFLDLWRDMAQIFKNYPNVLLELGNEPNGDPSHRDIWMQRSIKAIEIIREEGFTNYIIIPLPNVATGGHTALAYRDRVRAADLLDRYMWDFHYYWYHQESRAGTPDDYATRDVQDWLDRMGISDLRATGDRVLCGEFGVHGQAYDRRDMEWFENLITILLRDGYDMIAEAYQPNSDFPQLIGDWGTTDWHTLNTQGNVFVDALPLDIRYYEHTIGDAQDRFGGNGNSDLLLEVTSLLARARNTQSSLSAVNSLVGSNPFQSLFYGYY